ncbi:MAG: fatty acid desaturase [Vicinamibacteria bacterium]|jgi:fatty acid desaturase|nr:fatty acid desaturase [Vicinamibacteria bacterium]
MKANSYAKSVAPYKQQLAAAMPREELQGLHQRSAARHLLYAARQFGIIAVCSIALWRLSHSLWTLPFVILQGVTFFNMTVLLHEAVHQNIFAARRPRLTQWLGRLYALASGISAAQFTRWHLDHHANLGSSEDDPKRRWLSPRYNSRLYKLLYCTPLLIPLYFRAAARENASYPQALRRVIAIERAFAIVFQLSVAAALARCCGLGALLRIQIIPYLFVFPIAFTLNRLGQHYFIDPTHPLKWTTWMRASRLTDFIFLCSSYHLEHHYFPNVPFYRLRRLHFRLQPFCEGLGLRPRTYRELVWGWFVRNGAPHTDWSLAR